MACTEKNYWYTPDAKNAVTAFGKGLHQGPKGTGKVGDRYYYKGQEWLGNNNRIGQPGDTGKITLIRKDDHSHGLMPI